VEKSLNDHGNQDDEQVNAGNQGNKGEHLGRRIDPSKEAHRVQGHDPVQLSNSRHFVFLFFLVFSVQSV
jgi:hypothetical protein